MRDSRETLQNLVRELGLPPAAAGHVDRNEGADTTRSLDVEPAKTADGATAATRRADPSTPGLTEPVVGSPWERYEDLGLLGRGGMGEVRRVRDRILGRELAMKLLPPEVGDTAEARARFLAEARLTARLQHPGIVPVHDCGALPGGLLWFTMKLVRGATLGAVIRLLHVDADRGPSPEARSRVIDLYMRVCEAVAYAHGEGVTHRDLKPDNVMLGEFGEVAVMDWGIARTAARAAIEGATPRDAAHGTQTGRVLGTPAYMPPEQALGDVERLGPTSDVYALGAILYAILCGAPPYAGTPEATRAQVVHGPPVPLAARCRGPIAADLVAICEHAMARAPEDRPANAHTLAEEIRRFLDGARRRERARATVREALAMSPAIEASRARARGLHTAARIALARLEPHSPDGDKAAGWALEDEARALDRAATQEETARQQKLHAALLEVPDLDEAHHALAEAHLVELRAAEQARDAEAAARAESLLRVHARGRQAELVRGDGALTLITTPAGADVSLFRYVLDRRRLRAELVGALGRTPLHAVPIAAGSYLLRICAEGRRETSYPVSIGRGEHWNGARPGTSEPLLVPLIPEGTLLEEDVFVPPGWFVSGGDPQASESLPSRRRWADGFLVKRYPVTQGEYLAFLNDLLEQGRESEADSASPRAGRAVSGSADVPFFERDRAGRYYLGAQAGREQMRYPVASVSWHGAMAYAAWYSARSGRQWRLLGEEEREKAARGVDGRFFPWGDQPETTWACMVSSRPGAASPAPVEAYPTDESPYGVRGLAGNVRDWCAELWTPEGPSPESDLVSVVVASTDDPGLRAIRGGSWSSAPPAMCRASGRFAALPEERFRAVGLRLASEL